VLDSGLLLIALVLMLVLSILVYFICSKLNINHNFWSSWLVETQIKQGFNVVLAIIAIVILVFVMFFLPDKSEYYSTEVILEKKEC
jgi:protein-S-isoprenylcysteine O-methyltransferase Ste14